MINLMNIERVSLCLTPNKLLRSYGDGATAKSLISQTGGARDRTADLWVQKNIKRMLFICHLYATNIYHMKSLVVYRFSGNVMMSIITLSKIRENLDVLSIFLMPCDK